jgi:myo-inositol-1(or 4)-monophosphatase
LRKFTQYIEKYQIQGFYYIYIMIPAKSGEILEEALRKGGEVLLDYHGKSLQTTVKESISSVVTEADLASEKAIFEILQNTRESFNIISEEAGYTDHGSRYCWVVDPLDGTSNFAAGLPWFGVIIALFEGNSPVLGGMYLPVEERLYFAETGMGAHLNDSPIHTTGSPDLHSMLVSYSFDFSNTPGKTRSEMELLEELSKRVRNIRSTNSLVDFCYTADGRLGAAINQTTRIWDIAAAWLMITEAGGKVTDIDGEEILFDLSPDSYQQNYTIIVSGEGIHQQLLKIIQPFQL